MKVQPSTINEVLSADVAFPNRHNFHSAITERLQKYMDLKEELVRIWQLKTVYIIPLVLSTTGINTLNPELNPICYLLALVGAHHFLHVNRMRVKLLTFRLLVSYIYGAPILDVSRSHTTTQHSR